jgi:1-phosphofructokinase
MNIITLTLNPAFDVHCATQGLTLHRENLAHVQAIDAGGKGINISRALTANKIPNTPVVVLGEENGDLFRRKLQQEKLYAKELTVSGRIRENMTFHESNAAEPVNICLTQEP